ncbi:MAG: alpha/beta fold hydrolase [Pirellulales bacterium]|nr:alpha/beta fold hydrolase [Pirellulales bacterium]
MRKIVLEDATLAVAERGEGKPLVLIHGFPLDHTMWEPQLAMLARQCRVIAPDLRGFGHSSATEGTVTMEQMADDVVAVAEALGVSGRFVLGGLSMGGYVAMAFWRKYASRLAGLILCDTRAGPDAPEAAAARLDTADRILREGPALLVDSMTPRLLAESTRRNQPELVAAVQDVILRANRQGVAAALRGMAQRPDSTSILSRIDCPTLVLVGREDPISPPEEMRAMAEAIPGARLAEIPRAAHLAPLENPVAANAAIAAFLAQCGG